MPERPIREWQIEGPFGGSGVVNRDATEAAIRASTWEIDPSVREQISGLVCFSNADSTSASFESGYRVDLNTGQFTRVYHINHRPFHVSGNPSIFDRQDEARARASWPTVWDRDAVRWVLRDADTGTVIASQNCDPKTYVSKPSYSADRRWVTVSEDRTRSSDDLPRQIRRWIGRHSDGIGWLKRLPGEIRNVHLCIFDPVTGAKVNDVPAWEIAAWTAAGDEFWTIDNLHGADGNLSGVTCRLWSTRAAYPAWWLWLLTAAGILITARDLRWAWSVCRPLCAKGSQMITPAATYIRPKSPSSPSPRSG